MRSKKEPPNVRRWTCGIFTTVEITRLFDLTPDEAFSVALGPGEVAEALREAGAPEPWQHPTIGVGRIDNFSPVGISQAYREVRKLPNGLCRVSVRNPQLQGDGAAPSVRASKDELAARPRPRQRCRSAMPHYARWRRSGTTSQPNGSVLTSPRNSACRFGPIIWGWLSSGTGDRVGWSSTARIGVCLHSNPVKGSPRSKSVSCSPRERRLGGVELRARLFPSCRSFWVRLPCYAEDVTGVGTGSTASAIT